MNLSNLQKAICGLMVMSFLVIPNSSQAQVVYSTGYQPRTAQETIAYLFGVIAQLQAQLQTQINAQQSYSKPTYYYTNSSNVNSRTTNSNYYQERNPYFVNVVTFAPSSISRTNATLNAEVDKGGSDSLDVWFEYGAGGNLTSRSSSETITYSGRRTVEFAIDRLNSNTTYNYRIVAEDENGNRHYGQIRSFDTVTYAATQNFSGSPTAETEGARSISSRGAYIGGFVSMNDYDDGVVFFAYGRYRSDVNNVTDYDSYDEITTSYDDEFYKSYRRYSFNGRNTVEDSASGLKNATTYYYRVCVEYNKRNPKLRCGQVESFTTLNN